MKNRQKEVEDVGERANRIRVTKLSRFWQLEIQLYLKKSGFVRMVRFKANFQGFE